MLRGTVSAQKQSWAAVGPGVQALWAMERFRQSVSVRTGRELGRTPHPCTPVAHRPPAPAPQSSQWGHGKGQVGSCPRAGPTGTGSWHLGTERGLPSREQSLEGPQFLLTEPGSGAQHAPAGHPTPETLQVDKGAEAGSGKPGHGFGVTGQSRTRGARGNRQETLSLALWPPRSAPPREQDLSRESGRVEVQQAAGQ